MPLDTKFFCPKVIRNAPGQFLEWPPETIAAVDKMRTDGVSNVNIAAALGIDTKTLRRWFDETGRPRSIKKRRKGTFPDLAERVAAMRAENLTAEEIAAKLGVSEHQFYRLRKIAGISLAKYDRSLGPRPPSPAHNAVVFTPDMIAAIPALREKGFTAAQVAEKLGVVSQTFINWRKRTGYVLPPLPGKRGKRR